MEFQTVLDQELKRLNSDYEAKRYKDMTMVYQKSMWPKGLFYRWLEHKKLGATQSATLVKRS